MADLPPGAGADECVRSRAGDAWRRLEPRLLLGVGSALAVLAGFYVLRRPEYPWDAVIFATVGVVALVRSLTSPHSSLPRLHVPQGPAMSNRAEHRRARISKHESVSAAEEGRDTALERVDSAVPEVATDEVVAVVYRSGLVVPISAGGEVGIRPAPAGRPGAWPLPRWLPGLTWGPAVDDEIPVGRGRFLMAAMAAALIGVLVLHRAPLLGVALFVASLLALAIGAQPTLAATAATRVIQQAARRARLLPLGLALGLAFVNFLETGRNEYTATGLFAWVGSVAAWLWAWWPWERRQRTSRAPSIVVRPGVVAALAAILAVAALFLFYDLPRLPSEMTSDHAEKLLDVRDVLAGKHPIFFTRNTGRESAQFYVTAFLAGPVGLGLSHLALKVGTALVGWLTVPLMYLAARRGAGAPQTVALAAAALLAVSKWHTEIARVGLRYPYASMAVALVLIFLLRAVRANDRRDWLLAGAAFGAGLYGYSPFRAAALLLVAAAILSLWSCARRNTAVMNATLVNAALAALTALIVFLPLGHYAQLHPDAYWYRAYTRVAEGQTADPWGTLLLNIWNAVLMFHWQGDVVWVNSVPLDPVLDPVTGALFLLGLGYLVLRFARLRQAVDGLVLVGLPVMLLPSVLALGWPGENPSVVRAAGALPIVMLIAAWPLGLLVGTFANRRRPKSGGLTAPIFGGVLIGAAALANWQTYTVDYRASYDQSAWNTTELAAVIREWAPRIGGAQYAYVKTYRHWVDHRNVAINLGDIDWNSVYLPDQPVDLNRPGKPEPRLVIANVQDRAAIQTLESAWAAGTHYVYQSRVPTKEFWVFVKPDVPR